MDRYVVVLTPEGTAFGVLDRELYDYCGFPDARGRAERLTWKTRGMAEAWLLTCYQLWQQAEAAGKEVPERWRPAKRENSPFDRGWGFYS